MTLGWPGIVRLGLVQTALGAVVVLATSTLNRIMVVELALWAAIPGALVAMHHVVQVTRPRWGHGSDAGGRRTPWIVGGMATLALGGFAAAAGAVLTETSFALGLAISILAYLMIGGGVAAAGTSLLALLATHVAPRRRAAAATIVWMMMIAGFVVTTIAVGAVLDPYSHARLLEVIGTVCATAFAVSALAVLGLERSGREVQPAARAPFLAALAEVWAEPRARNFTIFVGLSMLAYSMQDLILEPYAGEVFGLTPGESTSLSGVQNAGVFAGMLLVGIGASGFGIGSLRFWTVAGCVASAAALGLVTLAGQTGAGAPLQLLVAFLGFANGVFAVAAIASMMGLAGGGGREGTRMGLWGGAQALAFGFGGFLGAASVDVARRLIPDLATAYGTVFLAEAAVFLLAAALAARIGLSRPVPANAIAGE
jgi:BCD family chlorophyll transporter-like MFS transporter